MFLHLVVLSVGLQAITILADSVNLLRNLEQVFLISRVQHQVSMVVRWIPLWMLPRNWSHLQTVWEQIMALLPHLQISQRLLRTLCSSAHNLLLDSIQRLLLWMPVRLQLFQQQCRSFMTCVVRQQDRPSTHQILLCSQIHLEVRCKI